MQRAEQALPIHALMGPRKASSEVYDRWHQQRYDEIHGKSIGPEYSGFFGEAA